MSVFFELLGIAVTVGAILFLVLNACGLIQLHIDITNDLDGDK